MQDLWVAQRKKCYREVREMVGHIYKLEYALYPNFTIIDFQSTVRAIDSFVYTISVDITGLERFFLLSFSWRLCEGRTELKNFKSQY